MRACPAHVVGDFEVAAERPELGHDGCVSQGSRMVQGRASLVVDRVQLALPDTTHALDGMRVALVSCHVQCSRTL